MGTHSGTGTGDRGFSLVELLIVIVILGILATVTVFAVRGISDSGETASCQQDEQIVQRAVEAYFAQTGAVAIPTSNPAVPGVSGLTAEDTLIEAGFMRDGSTLHDVATDGTVSPVAPC